MIRKSSIASSGSSTSDFTINVGSSGNTGVLLSTSFPAGSYICTSSLSDTSIDIYLIASDGTSAGYVNTTTATTTITATKSFNKVVIYGATNNDTLAFAFKYVFSPTSDTTNYAAPARLISSSPATLPNQDDTVTLTGENFATDVSVVFIGTDNVERSAKSTVRNSSTSITVTRPDNLPVAYSPYSIKAVNPSVSVPTSSNSHILSGAVAAGASPSWTTASALPSFTKTVGYSQQVLATDSDGGSSITYNIVSGSLPDGITFNTANSTFSGTPSVNSATPYSYTVRATDSGGNFTDRTFTLTQAVPDAPTVTGASDVGTSRAYNNGAASVSFSAPSYIGTSAITSYTVTASTGQTATGASSPITVTGIATNATPTFTVTATNSSGTSLTSSASSSVTITTVPAAPTIGNTSVTNSTTVSIPFTEGATGGKAITSYSVISSPSISIATGGGTSSPVTATGTYVGGQSYTFSIAAVNANGTSSYSSASNSLIPLNLPSVSGGTLSSDATYYYRTFDSNGSLVVSNASLNMEYWIIGGGGAGGIGDSYYGPAWECGNATLDRASYGAGGGGGGIQNSSTTVSVGTHAVTVGAGGNGNGSASSIFSVTAGGGNAGASYGGAGGSSGSPQSRPGGGNSSTQSGTLYCNLDGESFTFPSFLRSWSGGGGGAGSNGGNGSGGNGSGGGGLSYLGTMYSAGGNAGGGGSGSANTGRGADGNSGGTYYSGGSGRVIVRYLKSAVI